MIGRLVLICLMSCLARAQTGVPRPVAAAEVDGEQVLAESGFSGGLIVYAGINGDSNPLLGLHADSFAQPNSGRVSESQAMHRNPNKGLLSPFINVLVHGLVRDRDTLEAVRDQIHEAGAYGRVSAMLWQGPLLPYGDGMVNLLVMFDEGVKLDPKEIDRVLAPGGVAVCSAKFLPTPPNKSEKSGTDASERSETGLSPSIFRGSRIGSPVIRKPWPADTDEWTHSRYDSTGNAVSKDKRVGPPQFLQWEATPQWNRGVKTSCLVSTQGRIFYVLDDSHFSSEVRAWSLIARDASNGIQLWRHELPSWRGAIGGKKVGPAQVHRRLVASGNRVYATLGESAPVSVLDAATGEVLRVLADTESAEEFLLSDGILVALVNPNTPSGLRRGVSEPMSLVALDPATGDLLWKHEADMIMPLTMAADAKQAVYHDGKVIKSLDLRTGALRWTSSPTGQKVVVRARANPDSPGAEKSTIILAPQFAPTLILYGGVVAFAGGQQLNVLSAENGHELWKADYASSNYSVPVDLFGFDGHLWGPDAKMNLWRPLDDNLDYKAYDPLTGTIQKSLSGKYGFRFQHHRCHQMKVVDNTVVGARAGIEFLNTETGEMAAHHWVRGSCFYGVMPANGLLYLPPHNCACYVRAKLSGFMALNATPSARSDKISAERRLQRGSAYGKTARDSTEARPEDWPTYRHDPARSGRATTPVGAELLLGWQTLLGGALTSPVVADNRVYVASKDAHKLYALDAMTGKTLWEYAFDARVDSPPTIHEGLVLCGCRDGSVHALRATDGALVWRFLASPEERLIVSRGQLESVWPVSGSVLVLNGTAYFAAGKSSYLDGGIHLYGLDPHTGRTLVDTVLLTRGDDGSELMDEQGLDGFLDDILASDGKRIFMRHHVLDGAGNPTPERVAHLHGADGYLSADTTARLQWMYAPMYTSPHQGAFYDLRLARALFPAGRILVEDDEVVYGYGQNHYDRPRPENGGTWALFAAEKESDIPLDLSAVEYRKQALSGKLSVRFRWWKQIPIQVWAMVKTEDVLLVAGPRGDALVSQAALDGETDAALLAVSPADGRVLAEMTLPSPPAWDGMAAAGGNLYLALKNGEVLCLWDAASGKPGTPLSPAAWRVVLPEVKIAAEPDLLGRWRFDEGTGMVARDCSGHGSDAEASGRWEKNDAGTCLATDGLAHAAVIPDAPHLQFGNEDFTLALWVKVDGRDVRLLGKEAFPEDWWVINLLGSGRAELVLGEGRGDGRSVRATTVASITPGAWTHLAAVVDRQAREVRWHLNGVLDSRAVIPETMTRGLRAAGRAITIPSAHKPFRGYVGDFRVYGQAISADRVRELFEEEASRRVGMHKGE